MNPSITLIDQAVKTEFSRLVEGVVVLSVHRHVVNFTPVGCPEKILALVDSFVPLGPRQLCCQILPPPDPDRIAEMIARSHPVTFSCRLRLPQVNQDLNPAVSEMAWQTLIDANAEPPDLFSKHIQCHLSEAITRLLIGLTQSNQDVVEDGVCQLLGLGSGLTPSGDDFLSGLLIAMRLPHSPFANQLETLKQTINRHLTRTHPLSAAFIGDAASAQISTTLQDVIDVLYQRDCHPRYAARAIEALTDLGHRSGYDLLSGLLAGLPFLPSRSKALCPYIAS